jgi:hypothetical protein
VFWADGTKIAELAAPARWKAKITYDYAPTVEREIEELSELHDIVERGPNFHMIEKIEIVINPKIDRKRALAEIDRKERSAE